jgi:hypothetical protein
MKTLRNLTAALLSVLVPTQSGIGQQMTQDAEVVIMPTGEAMLHWFAKDGRTYFIQSSDPNDHLGTWIWSDVIESGHDHEISHEVGNTTDKGFFRLHYTDAPPPAGVELEDWDADGDGLPNALELSHQGNPLNPDTSGDGIPDGWAYAHGLALNANNASGLFQGGPATNLQAYQQGVQANPDATIDDNDGDGVDNEFDAVPDDSEINWEITPETQYLWIGQVDDAADIGQPVAVNGNAQILFRALNRNVSSGYFDNVLWNSATREWTALAAQGNMEITVGEDLWTVDSHALQVVDLNDSGTVAGYAEQPDFYGTICCSYPGMIWKRSEDAPAAYDTPYYFYSSFPIVPFVFEVIEPDIGPSVLANDGTYIGLAHGGNSPAMWKIHDTNDGGNGMELTQLIPDNPLSTASCSILDSTRSITAEWEQAQPNTPGIWLQEGAWRSPIGSDPVPFSLSVGLAINIAPSEKDQGGERLWLGAHGTAYLEKRAGGIGAARWHVPPSMSEGASFLHPNGVGVTRSRYDNQTQTNHPAKLWRNGLYTDLNEVASKPETVTITQAIDLASNGIILAKATDGSINRTGILIPLDMTISHPELDGEDPPEYVVNADIAETLITVGLAPAGDGSIIVWDIEEGDGTLSETESEITDGFASTTLTTSTSAGDTYRIKAKIKKLILPPVEENSQAVEFDFTESAYANLTGIEKTTDIITVIPGYAAFINVQHEPAQQGGTTSSMPADGKSEMTLVATVEDQFGQPVAENTPIVWHLGGLGSIEPETPATDAEGIARATLIAGDADGPQTVRIEADGFEVSEIVDNTAVTGTLTAGATTLDIATGETTTLTANFPDVADGVSIHWFTSRGEVLNAAGTVENGQVTATLRAGGGRTGNAIVTAAVGAATHALEIGFVSSAPISVEVAYPVIVGDQTTAGTSNVPRIDGSTQSIAYHTGTPITIRAPAHAGQTATVQFGAVASNVAARLHFDEITGTITPDSIDGHDATIHGAILDANQRHEGNASLYFDGANASLTIADDADLRVQSGMTVSAWVQAAASAGTIIHKTGEYRLFIDAQGRAVFGLTTTAGEQLVVGPELPLHRWSLISASLEQSGTITVSVDGMKAFSQPAGNFSPGISAISIGESFEGWLDLLEITRGNQFINGTGLDITGLTGSQVVLDGNGEAILNVSSGQQSVVSPESPVHSVAMRVSINPEVELEDVIVVVTKEEHAVISAAMSDLIVTTASQPSNLSGANREDVVARNLLEFARTGQRASALPFVPAGSVTERLRYSHRAAIWLGKSVDAAQDVREILENSHPLDLPLERKYHLSDQIQVLLTESMRGGSDSSARQYLDDAYGGLVGTLAEASGQQNFKHLTTLVDGGAAFEDMAVAHENFGDGLIKDIAILAGHETDDPTFCQRVFGVLRKMNDVVNGQWQQTIFDNTEDFLRKYVHQAVANGGWTVDEAFGIGFGWGLAAEAQAVGQLANRHAARRLSEQMTASVMLAIRGDENARKGLMEAIPLWGLKVMNDETNNLIEQGFHFDAGMKSAQLSVGIVGTVTAVGGMAKGAVSLSRAAKNAAKPLKGGPPRLPASFGRAITQDYRKTFFDANPKLQGEGYWVHHAVPRDAIKKGWITWQEGHSLPNLRGIPPQINVDVHLSQIAKAWNSFKKPYLKPGAQPPTIDALLKFATDIDDLHGMKFDPKTR